LHNRGNDCRGVVWLSLAR